MKPGATNSLLHTGHFVSIINDSLNISGHSHFELFFAVRYFRENMVSTLNVASYKGSEYGQIIVKHVHLGKSGFNTDAAKNGKRR